MRASLDRCKKHQEAKDKAAEGGKEQARATESRGTRDVVSTIYQIFVPNRDKTSMPKCSQCAKNMYTCLHFFRKSLSYL